jgi:hypothetical protein
LGTTPRWLGPSRERGRARSVTLEVPNAGVAYRLGDAGELIREEAHWVTAVFRDQGGTITLITIFPTTYPG